MGAVKMDQVEHGDYQAMAAEAERLRKALAELARYFTSGNSVPVERASITAKDFWRITGLAPADVDGLVGATGLEALSIRDLLPEERGCCGTFNGSHHRATCPKYRGKFKPYDPDSDPTAGKPWPTGLDAGRMGSLSSK